MLTIEKDLFSYFDETEFYNTIGEELSKRLEERGFGNQSVFLINYVCNQIRSYIYEHTAKSIFKVYDESDPLDYTLKIGLVEEYSTKLNDTQVLSLKLACIYQADYILNAGSTERMSGISVGDRFISKEDLKSFSVCDISRTFLSNAGLLYSGLGGGMYAWIK